MKKFIAILLCIAMAFALTACSGGNSSDAQSAAESGASKVESKVEASSAAASSEAVSSVPEVKKEPVKIMPMGDSLTHGNEHNECGAYRPALLKMLDEDGVPYEFVGTHNWASKLITNGQVMHSGYGGSTVFKMEPELEKMKDLDPDIVLLMLGRNDSSDITGETFTKYYYEKIISKLYAMFPDVTVYVASVPPMRRYTGEEALESNDRAVNLINPSIKTMVEEKKAAGDKIEFVDMSAEATGLTWEDFTKEDFVHPLPESYAKIATQWHNAIKDKVKEISDKKNGR